MTSLECINFNTTEIVFSNLAIKLVAPHMAFQSPLPYRVAIDFGIGINPTATYQGIGTNTTDITTYLSGGGAITLTTISPIIKGSVTVKGILYYSDTLETRESSYYGSVTLTTITNINPNDQTKIKLDGTISGIGIGSFNNTTLSGSLFGEGTVTIAHGIRKIIFQNGSISLVLGIP